MNIIIKWIKTTKCIAKHNKKHNKIVIQAIVSNFITKVNF